MTTALFEAAQQIEGAKSGLKREELAIAPVQSLSPSAVPRESESFAPAAKKQTTDRSRALRLEQNRKAARESRRRKKAMIEELQRSLMFFSKANEHLKQQNELMTRQLLEGHNKLASMGKPVPALDPKAIGIGVEVTKIEEETAPAMVADIDGTMQPGATMQAMATFQQAAHAAMEAASRNMQAHGAVVKPSTFCEHDAV
jgi:bZIP transcription factor